MEQPAPTRYARSGDLAIAYQVVGQGPPDVVLIPGFISHVELNWEIPLFRHTLQRLSRVARVTVFDKRGTGLSDRKLGHGAIEERMDDIRAVMDDIGMESACIYGMSEGGPMALMFAATHPARVTKLVLGGTFARVQAAPDYPIGSADEMLEQILDSIERKWGTGLAYGRYHAHADDPAAAQEIMARFERYSCTPHVAREIMESNMRIDVRPVLGAITAPTLVQHATRDPVVPVAWGRYVAEHVPTARMVELDGDFHGSWRTDEIDAITAPVEEFITGSTSRTVSAHRVLASVLFTDITGSTQRASALGDDRWRALLGRHDDITRQELTRHRGREVKSTGDGFLATFDGPARAVRCAEAIIERCHQVGLTLRAAVHTGECEVRGEDVAGIGVHIAARILGHAEPGEVLVSSAVRDLVIGSGLSFEDRGTTALKGVPGEWQLLRAHG